eukprot:jgi/Mesvir1/29256/Mv19742-RA.3
MTTLRRKEKIISWASPLLCNMAFTSSSTPLTICSSDPFLASCRSPPSPTPLCSLCFPYLACLLCSPAFCSPCPPPPGPSPSWHPIVPPPLAPPNRCLPSLVPHDACPQDIPVAPQAPRVDLCESCARCAAAIHCRDCDSYLCRLCSSRRHKKGNMLLHRLTDRGEGASMSCEMCSSAPDLVYCPTCDVGCCTACDQDLHRKLPMALHRRAPNVLSSHEVHFSAKMPLPVVLKGVERGLGVNRGKALRALEVAGWNVGWSTRFLLFMKQLGGFKKLLAAAAENKSHSARAYRCVAELCKTSANAARCMVEELNTPAQISKLLSERPERPALLTQACEALAQLIAQVPDACAPFLPSLVGPVLDVTCPVKPGAVDATDRNPVEIPWLLKAGLRALGYVTMHSAAASAVAGRLGAVPAVLAAMEEHAGAGELQAAAALAVQGLFVSSENRRQLLKARALRGLIRAVRQHPTDRAMLTVVFKALGSVAGQHVAVAAAAGRHRTVEQVIWAVRGNIDYPLLVAAGFDALTGLCNAARPTLGLSEGEDEGDEGESGDDEDARGRRGAESRGDDEGDDDEEEDSGQDEGGEGNREEILEAGAVSLVLNVMSTLATSPEAQTASCKLLGAIMVNLPDVAEALREGGAVPMALAAMQRFPAHAPLQAAACDALSALVAYGKGPEAAIQAVKGGAVGLLLAALAAHARDARVAEDSCLLLAGLCAECPDEALSVGEHGGVALLVSALSNYMDVYEVLVQVATALRCVLAGYPENAARARRVGAQGAALQLLRRHVGDVRLVAAAADILAGVTVERDCARGVVEDGGLALLRGALDLHYKLSAGACAVVVEAVRQVCESSGTESKRIAGELGFVEALVEALEAHAGDPPTAASCMGALRVITLVPENADRFRRTRATAIVRSALSFVNPTPAAGSCDALVAEEAAGLLALGTAGVALGDTYVVHPVLPRPGAPMTVADKVAHVFKHATESAQAEVEAEAQWQPNKQEEVARPATLFLDVDTS